MADSFRIGVTRNLVHPDGRVDLPAFGLDDLAAAPGAALEFLPEHRPLLPPEQVPGFDALILEGTTVTRDSLAGSDRLLVLCRFGAGYDSVDVAACTERGILVTNAPDGTQRPMAVANLTFILALTTRLLERNRLTRQGQWEAAFNPWGMGLVGRTLGVVGLGHIGSELLMLARPLGMQYLVHDPYASDEKVAAAGARRVDLETLFSTADVVCITCALTPETRGLVGGRLLSCLKPTAYFINAARGPIVDQRALTDLLRERRIAGAALDVFDPEPIAPDDPLLALDNVIVTPHGLANTDEGYRRTGESVTRTLLAVMRGEAPHYVVNPTVLEDRRVQARLQALAAVHRERG